MHKENLESILNLVGRYFQGIYTGNIDLLRSVFHPNALLFGEINGQPYYKNVTEYLEGVKNRKSPRELGEPFRMKPLSIEILNGIAQVKLLTPMFDFNYHDYLSMNKLDDNWIIVGKNFTHLGQG